MRPILSARARPRLAAAAAAVMLQALLAYVLLAGLTVRVAASVEPVMRLFDVVPPPVAPTIPSPPRARRPAGAAAPPARRARATPVVAPIPVVAMVTPPPIVAAPLPAIGAEAVSGAALAGPGSGGGVVGGGTGTGGAGTGDGGGGTPARWLRGRIRDADYPRAARDAGIEGDLATRYAIDAKGRVIGCSVVRSSGNADLDATTCRLAIERFRYWPARDADGRAVADVLVESHHWVIDEPAETEER